MKLRYSISYFILMVVLLVTFIYSYAFTNQYKIDQYVQLEEEMYVEEIVLSNSDEVVTEGFYLREEDGYVVVYLYNNETIYEETDILMSDLNVDLQEEIVEGKYMETEKELYAFLENYSS